MKHRFFLFFFILIFCLQTFGEGFFANIKDYARDKHLLYSARNSFTSGDYASALKYAEEAKVFRKNQVSSHIHSLEQAFKPREVQRKNDSLKDIILVLEKRDDFKALDIIHFYLQKKSVSDFKNSAATLLSHISMRKEFPEADWIIGSVYKLEGEYELSREYLLTAWKNSFLLDVPDEQFSILYELAELEKLQNNLDDYEKYLLLVLQNDKYFNNDSFSSATSNIINMKKDDSFEKFFLMFRSDNYKALKAYSLLSDYYTSLGKDEKALPFSSLALITIFSKVYDVVVSRDITFEYTDVASLFIEAKKYSDVTNWLVENNAKKLFLDFAKKIEKKGNDIFAKKIYTLSFAQF